MNCRSIEDEQDFDRVRVSFHCFQVVEFVTLNPFNYIASRGIFWDQMVRNSLQEH